MLNEERPPKGPINSSSDHHTASFTTSSNSSVASRPPRPLPQESHCDLGIVDDERAVGS